MLKRRSVTICLAEEYQMSEDPTQRMNARSFEERVLSELAAIRSEQAAIHSDICALDKSLTGVENRLTTLEGKVDTRLHETRPIWEAMQAMLEDIHSQMHEVVRDLYSMRGRISRLED